MFNVLRILTVTLATCLMAMPSAYAAPKQIRLVYDLTKNGMLIAHVTENFSQDGKQYRIQSVTKGVGIYALMGERKLISNGDVTKEGLKPKHFESLQSKNTSKALINDFDWSAKVLRMQVKGESKQETLEKGTQDLLSVMYQFMFVPPKNQDNIEVAVTIGKKLSTHQYQVSNQSAILETKAGKFKVLELKEMDGEDGKQIFLATNKQYIPVKIILRDDGDTLEQTLKKVRLE